MEKERVQKLIIFGTGWRSRNVIENLDREQYEIKAYADNNKDRHGKEIDGIPIISPKEIKTFEFDKIVICSTAYDEIYVQLKEDCGIDPSKIENHFYICKSKLLQYYERAFPQKLLNNQMIEVLEWIKNHNLSVFNYPFAENYHDLQVDVFFDQEKKLYYVFHNGKKMYFSKSFTSEKQVVRYYRGICCEQDSKSPHRYLNEYFYVNTGAVVVDAGVAEGNFALDIIDRVSKIYLIEPDEEWIEALQYTFESYREKVVLVTRFLSDNNNEKNITLDVLLKDSRVDFIKMDIEGAEESALIGGKEILSRNEKLKVAVCAYHRPDDEQKLRDILEGHNFIVDTSQGYMVFITLDNAFDYSGNKILVRGLLRAKKDVAKI